MDAPEGLLEVGRIGRPHGIKGDVFLDLVTDHTERAQVGSRLWGRDRWLTITQSSASNKRWRVHFDGVDNRNAAEAWTGVAVSAEPIDDPDASVGPRVDRRHRHRGQRDRSRAMRLGCLQSGLRPARTRIRRSRAGHIRHVGRAHIVGHVDHDRPSRGSVRAERLRAVCGSTCSHCSRRWSTGSARRACSARRVEPGWSICACTIRDSTPATCTARSTTRRSAEGRAC